VQGWIFPVAFTALPVPLLAFMARKAFIRPLDGSTLFAHVGFTALTLFGIVGNLTPYAVLGPHGIRPVCLTAVWAFGIAYLLTWWISRGKTAAALAIIAFGAAFAYSVREYPSPVEDLRVRIETAVESGDGETAEELSQAALRLRATMPIANYVLGSIALGKGELDLAERHLRIAFEHGGEVHPYVCNDLAEVCRLKRNFAEARRLAERATESGRSDAWDTLANVLLDEGRDLEGAEAAARKASVDGNATGMTTLARVQLKRGDREAARETVNALLPRVVKMTAAERRAFEGVYNDVR